MSINHYSSEIPEAHCWTQQRQTTLMEPIQNHLSSTSPPPSNSLLHHHYHHPMYPTTHSNISHRFNLNQNEDDEDDDDNENAQPTTTAVGAAAEEAKEAMFEKPLTPSDVGKLNRLVIPKQQAEKYFPLGGDSGESKGLLLSFEDEAGKRWRFRYSYWNSSQSYVLTKGWSRYVKEKRLDAGDVVLFERHRADAQRFFIGWRRRQQSVSEAAHSRNNRAAVGNSDSNNGISMGVGWTRGFYSAHSYPTHHHQPLTYQPHCLRAGIRGPQEVENQTTSPVGNSSRVLRLFGVNMECQPEHESGSSKPKCSYLSSTQGTATHHHQFYTHQPSYSPNSHNQMEF